MALPAGCSTPAQERVVRMIAEAVSDLSGSTPALGSFCSKATIRRYLCARGGDADAAAAMLRRTLEWRAEVRPEAITWQDVERAGQHGRIEVAGDRDLLGRPIIFYQLSKLPSGFIGRFRRTMASCSMEEQLRFWIYNLETACKMADDAGVGQLVVVADMGGFSDAVTDLASFVSLAQDHFPERLAFALLYRPPTLFWLAWTAVQAFLDEKTRAKISLAYSEEELRAALLPHIRPAALYRSLGGEKKDEFDLAAHRQRMLVMDAARQREAGLHSAAVAVQ